MAALFQLGSCTRRICAFMRAEPASRRCAAPSGAGQCVLAAAVRSRLQKRVRERCSMWRRPAVGNT